MDAERHWTVVELRIDRYGRVITVIPDNPPPEEVQYTEDTSNSEDSSQRLHSDFDILDALVPDMAYNVTPTISNDLTLVEPDLSVQESYADSNISDNSVPNVDRNEISSTLNDQALNRESGFHN
jgi:hypothetical protein